ncbi:hypothetical protein IQ270_11060 [Microcoleus sp. LEGE 07076]|uniref:hypothetical protein n=1 Tax=Microcoleus sp. LEGE 07076 TaxID=915322 RepID=UPI00187E3334|nr:hypothetical protein [Microcoleus sp. LEGE 07076]MBE9185240.1 hypothetical protein [Microcoleus sp. LEGE 07076]
MFGFIKNFFGGIFGFFGRLLGLKKSEYFMDLGESSAKEPAKVAPAKVEAAVAKVGDAVAAAPAKVEAVMSGKSEPAKKAKVEKKSKKEKEPVASVPAKTSEPAKVAAAATNGKVPSQAEPNRTFAPNNLMPIPTATRRSPGPSMNNFREMARQVKMK